MMQPVEEFIDTDITQLPLQQLNRLRLQRKLLDMIIVVGGVFTCTLIE